MEKVIEFLKERLIAHRGMHNIEKGIPENSIEAFEQAVKNNYAIELDVHILKDGNIVVFHDDNLERMTGVNKLLKQTKYNEIKDLKLQGTNSHIPLFKDVLNIINGRVPVIIELKTDAKFGRLEKEIVKLLKDYKGEFAVMSFNPMSVYWFRKNEPEIVVGQLSYDFKNNNFGHLTKYILKNMYFDFIAKPDFIAYGINALPNKRVEKIRKSKIVLGWTIKTKEDMEKAKRYCDNFICENFNVS